MEVNDPATRQLLFKFFEVSAQQLAGYDRATVESYLASILDNIFLARAVLPGKLTHPMVHTHHCDHHCWIYENNIIERSKILFGGDRGTSNASFSSCLTSFEMGVLL